MRNYQLRSITSEDEPILWQMLYFAAHLHEEEGKSWTDAQADPALALYVTAWGRPGDLGFIAETQEAETQQKMPIGAVWVRLFRGDTKAYSATDEETPELAVAVLPTHTGQGVGTALLQQLLLSGKAHFPAVALNVRADNPAFRLYQRLGFVVTGELTNRVGGLSYNMVYRYQ
ncbi:MAG TPA: N-acetyltransferase [Caldilineaceae bacterium]|nr:N-acetyltransferase [Caldilineaceae bacterium]